MKTTTSSSGPPICPTPGHGEMAVLSLVGASVEQRFCGIWYGCAQPRCYNTTLIQSAALRAQLEAQRATHPTHGGSDADE